MRDSGWSALAKVLAWPNNMVTISRMIAVTAIVAPMFAGHSLPIGVAAALFVLSYWAFDLLDGWLARRLGRCSSFGESLDLLSDRYCDLLLSAYVLTAVPDHVFAVTLFLLVRLAPDTFVTRFMGLQGSMFDSAVRLHAPRWKVFKATNVGWAIELNSLARTVFFCGVLFWHMPAWTGVLLIAPSVIYLGLVVHIMRVHAASVLGEHP